MNKEFFKVIRAGIHTTLQDLGRSNKYHLVVPFSGSMDQRNYLISNNIKYTKSSDNIGLCSGVYKAAKISTKDYLLYADDDMYFLPNLIKDETLNPNTKKWWDLCIQPPYSNEFRFLFPSG